MIHRIEVMMKEEFGSDPEGERVRSYVERHFGIPLQSVRVVNRYSLVENTSTLDETTLQQAAQSLFSDAVLQRFSIDAPLAKQFQYVIEAGTKPGVTDNEGNIATRAMRDFLKVTCQDCPSIYFSRQYLLEGALTTDDAHTIARDLLANALIENYAVATEEEFTAKGGVLLPVPVVRGPEEYGVEEISLPSDPGELMRLSTERCLALNLQEMNAIRAYFDRDDVMKRRQRSGLGKITDVELEILAQTWSEHCKHKEFNARIKVIGEDGRETVVEKIFDTYIRNATVAIDKALTRRGNNWIVKVFDDNAGVVRINEKDLFVLKVETHNAPSALDPYGGALTGIVGVNRDPAGIGRCGAELLFNTNVFCFGNPFSREALPPRILHPMRVFEGVRRGVEHGGNQSGIPTVNGSIIFDDRYGIRPLVFCGTGGVVPETVNGEQSTRKEILPGDLIVMAGGRVGKDGIHGATFSSQQLDESSPSSAVQIGDPITQRKMLDFLNEARMLSLVRAITDDGAGGLSSSIGELARIPGGARVSLDQVPLKYEGLRPWEIFLSESQERMTLAVDPRHRDELMELARRRDVELAVIGTFDDSGYLEVFHKGDAVASLELEFLHDGLPQKHMVAKEKRAHHPEPDLDEPEHMSEELITMLSRLNVCSREYVIRQYDHEVKGRTVIKPLCGICADGPSDASVIKPRLDSPEGLIVSCGICPKFSDIDPYWMGALAFDEAVRNIIATGGRLPHRERPESDMWCMNDNFCTSDCQQSDDNPEGSHRLWALIEAARALHDFSIAYLVPLISGKDSMKNNYFDSSTGRLHTIPLTVLCTVVAKLNDVGRAVSADVKRPGDLVYVCGITRDETGGSEYFLQKGWLGNKVPRVRVDETLPLYDAMGAASQKALLASCHDCSDGGLGVALAESAFSGGFGISAELKSIASEGVGRDDALLFSESAGRFVVTVAPQHREEFEKVMKGLPVRLAGVVTEAPMLIIRGIRGQERVRCSLDALKEAWKSPLRFSHARS